MKHQQFLFVVPFIARVQLDTQIRGTKASGALCQVWQMCECSYPELHVFVYLYDLMELFDAS